MGDEARAGAAGAIGKGGHDHDHLQRGGLGDALADGEIGEVVIGRGGLGEIACGGLQRQDGRRAETQLMGHVEDGAVAGDHGGLVEVGVAGADEGGACIEPAVIVFGPVVEFAAVDHEGGAAFELVLGIDGTGAQSGEDDDGLEDGAGRVGAEEGAVKEGAIDVLREGGEVGV